MTSENLTLFRNLAKKYYFTGHTKTPTVQIQSRRDLDETRTRFISQVSPVVFKATLGDNSK